MSARIKGELSRQELLQEVRGLVLAHAARAAGRPE
jgi:hypothetical protein